MNMGVSCRERLSSGALELKKATLITTPLLISVAGIAAAQDNGSHPFSVRAGYSYLANKDTRDATSNSGFTVGASYDLQSKYMGGMGAGNNRVSIDVDWDSHRGNGNIAETGSLQLAVRSAAQGKMAGGFAPYFGASVGMFRNHYRVSTTSVSAVVTTNSATKNVFGGSVLVGANISQQAFIEIAYRLSGSVDGVKFDTINAVVGVHF